MYTESFPANSDTDTNSPEWSKLVELVSIADHTQDSAELIGKSLDLLFTLLPYQYAFALLWQSNPPRVFLEQARNVPPALSADLKALNLPAEVIAELETPHGALRLEHVFNALAQLFDSSGYGAPIFVPLLAEGHALGVMGLVGDSPREMPNAWTDLGQRHKTLLDVAGAQIGLGLRRAQSAMTASASAQWYRTLIADSLDQFWETDADYNILYVNEAAARPLGKSCEELVGKNIDQLAMELPLLTAQEEESFETLLHKLKTEGAVIDRVVSIATADGPKTLSVTGHTVCDADGRVLRLQASSRDVTAEVRTRRELEQRTHELELLYELTTRLNKTIDTKTALDAGLDIIMQLTDADAIGICLVDEFEGHSDLVAHRGVEPELVSLYATAPFDRAIYEPGFNPEVTWNLVEYLVLTRRVLTTQDFLAMPRFDTSPVVAMGYQSFLAFPMAFDNDVYGVVLIGSKRANHFDRHDRQLGESISAQLGLAIHNQRIVADLQHTTQHAQALARIGRMIQFAPRAEAALSSVVREIKQVLGADYVVIKLLRQDRFQVVTATDTRERQTEHSVSAYEQAILESENPLQVTDSETPEVDARQHAILARLGLRASVSMRLFVHDHPLGILFVNQDPPRKWRSEHIEFVRRAAQQIAYALENKRLLDEITQQVRELQAVAHAARLIDSVLSVENALQAIADEIAQVFQVDCVSFHLRRNNMLELVARSGELAAPRIFAISRHQYRILDELDTVIVNDRDNEHLPFMQRELLTRYNFSADLGVPMVAGRKAVGILYLSHHSPRRWTAAEIRLAETFAHQIASALENARLLKETQSQVRDLRALSRSANLISTSRAPEDALPQIAYELRQVLQADYVGFHLLDGDHLRVLTEPQNEFAGFRHPIKSYHRLALENWQRIVVNDSSLDVKDEAHRALLQRVGFKADVGVPMISRGKPLGILFVSQKQPRAWQENELQLLETFAQKIAGVLDIVQLLNEKQARLDGLEQLAELNEITATILDEELLQDMSLAALKNLLNADHVSLILLDGDQFKPTRAADGRVHPEQPMPITPFLRQPLDEKKVVVVDSQHPSELDEYTRNRAAFYGARAGISVPLLTANEAIGVLNFLFRDDHVFTEPEIRLAQSAANQLAMAFVNARLLQEQKTRVDKLTELSDFSLFCGTIHDSVQLQTAAVKRICLFLHAKAASVRLIEEGMLTPGASYGYRNPARRNEPIEVDARMKQLLQQPKPYVISNLEQARDAPEHWRNRHLEEGLNALLMLPMIAENTVLGILALFHETPHTWNNLEMQYAQTFANTLALALSNVQQKEKVEHKSDELQATLDSVFSGVLATDAEGVIVWWNRQAEQITGFAAKEMLAKRWDVVGPRVGEARRDDTLILEAMADNQTHFGLATRYFTRADGRLIALREVATPLGDRAGNVRGAVCAFWDRTEEQAGERAKIDFINEVAHQLGNKLGAVIMSAQQLQRADLKDKTRERFVSVIANTVHDLEGFQKRFNAFQRERVQDEVQESEVNLREIVNEKIALLRLRKPKHKFRIGGKFDFVTADPQRLRVVIENLLDNAFKYSPPNTLIIVSAACPSPGTLVLKIRNKGEPIPPEVQPHLFKRWQRGNAEKPGSGLGLWLVRSKLHEMGGDICFESTLRGDTAFSVSLRRKVHQLPETTNAQAADDRSAALAG